MPELVQNGTFDSDVSGWASGKDAILSSESSKLRVTNDIIDYAYGYGVAETEIGKTYQLSVDRYNGTAGSSGVRAGVSAPTNATYYEITDSTEETNITTFVAIETLVYITLYSWSAGDTAYSEYDNVSLKEISYELPSNAEVQAVYSDGSRQTPEDAYNIFDDGMTKQVNFTDDTVLTQDIAIDYRNKL